jgi:hypothetical protein
MINAVIDEQWLFIPLIIWEYTICSNRNHSAIASQSICA